MLITTQSNFSVTLQITIFSTMSANRAPDRQFQFVSQTQTVNEHTAAIPITGTLRLRAGEDSAGSEPDTDSAPRRTIRWADDVVDNENMGKKSSKGEL